MNLKSPLVSLIIEILPLIIGNLATIICMLYTLLTVGTNYPTLYYLGLVMWKLSEANRAYEHHFRVCDVILGIDIYSYYSSLGHVM